MACNSAATLLQVDNLEAAYAVRGQLLTVLRGLNFSVQAGEVIGLLGESGCGKTTTALAILSLMPAGSVLRGSVRFGGLELIGAGEETLQSVRGAKISLIPQEPLLSLNPVIRVIDHVTEVVRAHHRISAAERRDRARHALQLAGLGEKSLHTAYPHQISGGQRQRVLIAQAIVCRPALIIADEPTASLDAVSKRECLELLGRLIVQMNTSLLLISHDPRVVAAIAQRVLVMYAGQIVEAGPVTDLLKAPLHPYTRGLLGSLLDSTGITGERRDRHVPAIDGMPPDFEHLPAGCAFEPRCPDRIAACAKAEPPRTYRESHEIRCFLYEQQR